MVVAPHLGPAVEAAAVRFEDQAAHNATVLPGSQVANPVAIAPPGSTAITVADVATGAGSALGGLALAFLALYRRRLPAPRRGFVPGAGLARSVQRLQSGVVNDYVTWIVVGLAGLGGIMALAFR